MFGSADKQILGSEMQTRGGKHERWWQHLLFRFACVADCGIGWLPVNAIIFAVSDPIILSYWTKRAPVTCVSSRSAFSSRPMSSTQNKTSTRSSGASAIHNSLDMFRDAEGVNKQKHSCTALRSERVISSNLKYALHIFERRDCRNTWLLHSMCRGTGTPFLHVSSRHRGREMSWGPNQSANENLPIGLRANPWENSYWGAPNDWRKIIAMIGSNCCYVKMFANWKKMVPLRPYVVTQVSIEISPKLPQVVVLQ